MKLENNCGFKRQVNINKMYGDYLCSFEISKIMVLIRLDLWNCFIHSTQFKMKRDLSNLSRFPRHFCKVEFTLQKPDQYKIQYENIFFHVLCTSYANFQRFPKNEVSGETLKQIFPLFNICNKCPDFTSAHILYLG